MILSDVTLLTMLTQFIQEPDYSLVNPASVDIRIGLTALVETGPEEYTEYDLKKDVIYLAPGDFALVSTQEWLMVPNGYAVELKLKSSRAREGYNHSLAFWFDPGWSGIGTMEIKNITKYTPLPLFYGFRFGQIIVHQLDQLAARPYEGRYQGAANVERAK